MVYMRLQDGSDECNRFTDPSINVEKKQELLSLTKIGKIVRSGQ